ncbi:MAG: hypothetical protein ACTHMS_12315 [Jatrophihabitans sp.]
MSPLLFLGVLLLLGLLPAFGIGADTRDRRFTVGSMLDHATRRSGRPR